MGTFGTAWLFGRPLTSLQQALLRLEADLRFGLVRLRCAQQQTIAYSIATTAEPEPPFHHPAADVKGVFLMGTSLTTRQLGP